MRLYADQFEPWFQGVDRSTDDIEDPFSVLEDDLYPFLVDYKNGHPLDHKLMAKRIRSVDTAILKCKS